MTLNNRNRSALRMLVALTCCACFVVLLLTPAARPANKAPAGVPKVDTSKVYPGPGGPEITKIENRLSAACPVTKGVTPSVRSSRGLKFAIVKLANGELHARVRLKNPKNLCAAEVIRMDGTTKFVKMKHGVYTSPSNNNKDNKSVKQFITWQLDPKQG